MPSTPRVSRPVAVSVIAHVTVLATLSLHRMHPPRVFETKNPGTSLGTTILPYYNPGSLRAEEDAAPLKQLHPTPAARAHLPAPKQSAMAPPAQTAAAQGLGSSTESGLGQGDMRIALPSYHPDPAPNLATLQPGPGGDVVLDAVIDETGHISRLTVLNSLGPAIDQSVIATVQQWVFTPATLDGKPVPSGQELHFHYQRKDTSA